MPSKPKDPFALRSDEIRWLASDPVVRRGIALFKEGQVVDLRVTGDRLTARVKGGGNQPFVVTLDHDEDGELAVECSCPFNWEPACKHTIAALLAYSARQPTSELEVEGAAARAIAQRVERGRTEVEVRHLSGDAWFGLWDARSTHELNPRRKRYKVHIRSLSRRLNDCSCPDFSANLLGTCKHIEAVLHSLRQQDPEAFEARADGPAPRPFIYLSWEHPEGPRICLDEGPGLTPELRAALKDRFDRERRLCAGATRGDVARALEELCADLEGRDDIDIGDDARRFAERTHEDAARADRSARIAAELRTNQNRLPGIDAELYPYQIEGVAFLASAGRALLADDMGLGKTLQAIAACHWLMTHEGARRALVVCPASLKHQWAREVERFTGLEAQVVDGSARQRKARYDQRAPFTIANYELIVRDREAIASRLVPDILVLDEAQRIRNWRTQTADAIKGIDTPFAFVLTGTPLENRLEDLYSLLQVVDPRVLGPLWRTLLDFHITDERGRVLGYRNLAELRRRIAPVMLRRDRRLVRDQLPERIEQRRDVTLRSKQRKLHDEQVHAIARLATLRRQGQSDPRALMAAIQRARMLCNALDLVDGAGTGSPKLEELERLLEELAVEGGHKVVVFSEWERMTALVETLGAKLDLDPVRLTGKVPTPQRERLVDRFQREPSCRLFISTDAGGVGLNLQSATALINLDVPWNPATLDQRIARVHRLGQRQQVQVFHIYAADSYEARVAKALGQKRALFDSVTDAESETDALTLAPSALEALVAEALGEAPEPDPSPCVTAAPAAASPPEPLPSERAADGLRALTPAEEEAQGELLDELLRSLGSRLQRTQMSSQGLVAIVDRIDARAERAIRKLSPRGVRIVDALAARALGLAPEDSPLGTEPAARDPLLAEAQRCFDAAQLLVDVGRWDEARPLLLRVLLAALARQLGAEAPPELAIAAEWLYAEVLPAGLLSHEEALPLGRGLALRDGAPSGLLLQLHADAGAALAQLEALSSGE